MSTPRHLSQYLDIYRFGLEHPDLPIPDLNLLCYVADKETIIRIAKLPDAKKYYEPNWLNVKVPITSNVTLNYYMTRSAVCTAKRRQTRVIPAQPEHTIMEVVEWECHPLLQPDETDKSENTEKEGLI